MRRNRDCYIKRSKVKRAVLVEKEKKKEKSGEVDLLRGKRYSKDIR